MLKNKDTILKVKDPETTMVTGPEKTMVTGPEKTMATGPEKTMATGRVMNMATGPVMTMATGPVMTTVTGPVTTMVTGLVMMATMTHTMMMMKIPVIGKVTSKDAATQSMEKKLAISTSDASMTVAMSRNAKRLLKKFLVERLKTELPPALQKIENFSSKWPDHG